MVAPVLQRLGTTAAAAELGEHFGKWVTQAELFHVERCDMSVRNRAADIGRAAGPKFAVVRAVTAMRLKLPPPHLRADPAEVWWARLVFNIEMICKLWLRECGAQQRSAALDEIAAAPAPPATECSAEPRQ